MDKLAKLRELSTEGKRVSFQIVSPNERQVKQVPILRLVGVEKNRQGKSVVKGVRDGEEKERTYRIDRIRSASISVIPD